MLKRLLNLLRRPKDMKSTTVATEPNEVAEKLLASNKVVRYKRIVAEYQSANVILEVRRRRT